jgi:hypothetical protein
VALAARSILEMAVCECPVAIGRPLTRWDLDELLVKATLLVEAATDSDAVINDLIEPVIKLHPNGEYTIDRSFHETVIGPFLENYFRKVYEQDADSYEDLYAVRRPNEEDRGTMRGRFGSEDFHSTFQAEYGLTPDEATDAFAELIEVAVERGDVVIATTVGELRDRLIQHRGLSHSAAEAFLSTFGLQHRRSWEEVPSGFAPKDIHPWRYRRRLSWTVRPLLFFGEQVTDCVMYGAGTLRQSFGYLLGQAENGQFPNEFFISEEMKRYVGAINDKRGHAFERSVADELRQRGWLARTEVNLTELEAPPQAADGDIDVLAWRTSGDVLVIECKRLRLARTVAEIAEVCRRFRGEAKDDLDKHVRRVNWLKSHPSSIERIVGFIPDESRIEARLVTDTHVPMMYLSSLPIDAATIGPIDKLFGPIVPSMG